MKTARTILLILALTSCATMRQATNNRVDNSPAPRKAVVVVEGEESETSEAKCKKDPNAKGSAYYDCLRYHDEKSARNQLRQEAEDLAAEREAEAEQERSDREAAAIINAFGEAFKPKPTTVCETKTNPYTGVTRTECH